MKALAAFWRHFDRLLDGMAVIACGLIAFIFMAIVYDVVTRNLGVFTVTWVLALTEYGLVYVTALGTPWLLRENGHVSMDALRTKLPPHLRLWLEKLVLIACILACIVASAAAITVIRNYWTMYDARARFLPRWSLYAPILLAFILNAIQFLRFLSKPGSFFTGGVQTREGL